MKKVVYKVLVLTAIFLMIAMMASVNAYTPKQRRDATVFIATNPQIVKLGEPVLVNSWTSPQPPLIPGGGMAGMPRSGYLYTITKPDGTTYTHGPVDSYGDGSHWYAFTPDQIGTWKLKMSWSGDEWYFPCESPEITFTVQTEGLPKYPDAELPTDYWTSPINAENREWTSLNGPWLQSGYNASYGSFDSGAGFNPFTTAPESAHILWKRQVSLTGLISGERGNVASGAGSAMPPVIMFGNVYYNVPDGFVCVDLRTGVEKWKVLNASVTAGQVTRGGTPYLWEFGPNVVGNIAGQGITIKRYNALNGQCNLVIPDGMSGVWNDGSVYITPPAYNGPQQGYGSNQEDTWFARWDASKMRGTDWQTGVVWNVTRPKYTMGEFVIWGDVAIFGKQGEREVAYNITNGEMLWDIPRENAYAAKGAGNGIFVHFNAEHLTYQAIDIYTGQSLWNTTPAEYPWGSFVPYCPVIAYDKLYTLSYDGHIYAFRTSDGSTAWKFYSGDTTETPYGTWAFWWGPIVADGKVYAGTGEHSPTQPLTRGNRLFCVDAETGEFEWSIAGMFKPMAIAEGYFLAVNVYDGYLYCFGKGQTTTTVSASPKITAKGSAIMIEGSVIDNSPAQFGKPAVSADSQTGLMEYLHMQKPQPTNTTGVPVKLTAIDKNGNEFEIGEVTSDGNGLFKKMWIPTSEGEFTIKASFEGSESYWASVAETAVGVTSASGASPAMSPTPTAIVGPDALPNTSVYVYIAAAIVVIAVIVVAVVLRSRK